MWEEFTQVRGSGSHIFEELLPELQGNANAVRQADPVTGLRCDFLQDRQETATSWYSWSYAAEYSQEFVPLLA